MTKTDRAYLAGILDGEGSVMITLTVRPDRNPAHSLHVSVSNTEFPLMEWIKEKVGLGGTISCSTKNRRLPLYHLTYTADNALKVLGLVKPYAIAKQQQIALGIAFQEHKSAQHKRWNRWRQLPKEEILFRDKIRSKIRKLNRGSQSHNHSHVKKFKHLPDIWTKP